MAQRLASTINCEELITVSAVEPKHRVFVLQQQKEFITSQNCLVFECWGRKFATCCLYDLKHVVADAKTCSREEVGLAARFYLFDSEQVSFLGVLLDERLLRFYEEVFNNNTSVKCRIGNFNPDFDQLASFAVFEYRGQKQFPSLATLGSRAPPLQLGEDILVLTNAFALSFKDLFAKTVHRAVCSSNTKFGLFLTDLRGFPDIEGGLVYSAGETPTPVGIVVPGIFHKNNYREYLTIGYRLDHFADQFAVFAASQLAEGALGGLGRIGQLHRQLASSKRPLSSQQSLLGTHSLDPVSPPQPSLYANPAIEFWADRVFKIAIFSPTTFTIANATGIAISPHLILTNQHIVGDSKDEVYIYNDGEKVRARNAFPSNGSIDMLFLFVDRPLKVSPVAGSKPCCELFAEATEVGETVFSVGYPIFRPKGSFNFTPFVSKGLLQNQWTSPRFAKPLLLLSSNLIFQGNSGGALINAKGQLVGLSFATLRIDKRDGDMGECVLNEIAVSVGLANVAGALAQALQLSTETALSQCLHALPYLHLRDAEISEATNFYVQRQLFPDRRQPGG